MMGERYERQAGVLGLSLGPATLALGAKGFGKGVVDQEPFRQSMNFPALELGAKLLTPLTPKPLPPPLPWIGFMHLGIGEISEP